MAAAEFSDKRKLPPVESDLKINQVLVDFFVANLLSFEYLIYSLSGQGSKVLATEYVLSQ